MNRLSAAWEVFRGNIDPLIETVLEPQYVIGDASLVKLYAVRVDKPQKASAKKAKVAKRDGDTFVVVRNTYCDPIGPYSRTYSVGCDDKYETRYYTSCEAANAAHPNRSVKQLDAVKIGDKYLPLDSLTLVEAASKPKVAKGKK